MPWSPKQHRMFCAAANDAKIAKKLGIPQHKARKLCREGVKKALLHRKSKGG